MSKLFAKLLATVLDSVGSFPSSCWWNCPHANSIIEEGVRRGWVYRGSTTQAHWTEAGVEAYREAIKGGA